MPPVVELEVWEQKVYEFGVELPLPEMPKPTADWGPIGLAFNAVCPGAPYCGNPDAETNCGAEVSIPFKIPGFSFVLPFPPTISLPPMKVRIAFPPKVILPINCPNYPEQEGLPAGA